MKPSPFEYERPESLADALQVLATYGDRCKVLAGGQSLIPLLAMRLAQPEVIVDVARVRELSGVDRNGSRIRIGAMTTNAEMERRQDMPSPPSQALPHVGHFQIRNRGTIGGSLAHMDPAAEWPALLLAMEGEVTLQSVRGRRALAAADFVQGPLMTALADDELLVEVTLPTDGRGAGFAEVARRPGDFALVGAACHRARSGRAGVVAFATGTQPHRLPRLEAALEDGVPDEAELVRLAAAELTVGGDIHATAEYRRQVGARMVARAVRQAWN
jgi:carbon-monoxide dehydrogenase medium subunit